MVQGRNGMAKKYHSLVAFTLPPIWNDRAIACRCVLIGHGGQAVFFWEDLNKFLRNWKVPWNSFKTIALCYSISRWSIIVSLYWGQVQTCRFITGKWQCSVKTWKQKRQNFGFTSPYLQQNGFSGDSIRTLSCQSSGGEKWNNVWTGTKDSNAGRISETT